jgi:glycosyltransferase involved in cell wall biosynthesis
MSRFKWTDVAQRLVDSARSFARMLPVRAPAIGWITTWNAKCGIATYSAHLVNMMPADVTVLAAHNDARTALDSQTVRRSWESGDNDNLEQLEAEIDAAGLDTLVIQFNYGFFEFAHFSAFLASQVRKGRKVVLMLHATIDPAHAAHKRLAILADAFKLCHRILVHAPGDLNRLKALGLVDNVALFPHGVVDWPTAAAPDNARFTISSYGFFLDHKGLPQLIDAMKVLVGQGRNVALRMVNAEYPIATSAKLVAQARTQIKALGLEDRIEIVSDFLEDTQSLALLGQADLLVFPYQGTGESSSAAVRYGLATGRPVAVTPLPIFDDVSRAVFYLPGQQPADLARGIAQIMDDIGKKHARVAAIQEQADRWRDAHRYSHLGQRLHNILLALHQDAGQPG